MSVADFRSFVLKSATDVIKNLQPRKSSKKEMPIAHVVVIEDASYTFQSGRGNMAKNQRKQKRCGDKGSCSDLKRCGDLTKKAYDAYRLRKEELDDSGIYTVRERATHRSLSSTRSTCAGCACSFETVSRGIARMEAPADPERGHAIYGDTGKGVGTFEGGLPPRKVVVQPGK